MKSSISSRNFDIVMVMDALLISLACLLIILAYREVTEAPVRHAYEMADVLLEVTDDLSSEDSLSGLRLDDDGAHHLRRRLAAAKKQMARTGNHSQFGIYSTHPLYSGVSSSADEFRDAALASVMRGEPRVTAQTELDGMTLVRMAAPLQAAADCHSCEALGYPSFSSGDIIGMREIVVPVGDSYAKTVRKLLYACGMLAASLMVFLGLIIPMMKRHRHEKAEMRDLANALELQASTDALTGLNNRRFFEQTLDALVHKFNELRAPLGLLVFDLDHFKNVNDTYGHDAGDLVLREVALRLRAITRDGDVVARIGGEEFAVVAPHATMDQMKIIAERYREMIGALRVDVGKGVLRPTISIGVACKDENPTHAADIFKAADRKLYQAKREGRNRVAA